MVEMIEQLSPRELDVLHLMAQGLTNRQIADRLMVSRNTVRVHAATIYHKMAVQNRTQAVMMGLKLGFVEGARHDD